MRLFVAINLPQEIQDYCSELQKKFPEANMKFAHESHLTLKFLGELDPMRVDELKKRLAKVKFQPLTIQLTELDVFKTYKGYIKVVWIGLDGGDGLLKLQKDIEDVLQDISPPEDRPFVPHLTLARVKFADDRKFEEGLEKIPFESKSFLVDSFFLISSDLSGSRPVYTELAKFTAL